MARGIGIAGTLLVVAVAAGAWMFWQARKSPTTATDPMVDVPVAARAKARNESSEPASNAAAFRSPQASAYPSRGANPPAQIGLKPLTIEQERRLQDFVDSSARDNADQRDYELLVDKEAPDAGWSDAAERRLEDAIRRHSARLTALHASAPYCTRTLCRMLATGGFNSDAPDADWQHLIVDVLRDPELRGAFMDQHTVAGGDQKGVMYVTYLMRRTD